MDDYSNFSQLKTLCWDNTLGYYDSYENVPKPCFYVIIFCQGRQLLEQFGRFLGKSPVAFQHSNSVGSIIGTNDIAKLIP